VTTPGPRRHRHRPGTPLRRAVAAGVTAAVLGLLGACSSDEETPSEAAAAEVTASPTRPAPSPTPTPTPTPTPSATPTADAPAPAPAPAPDAGADTGTASAIALRSGGRIGEFPVEAPESDVAAYLTEVYGSEPVVEDPESACGHDVGRRVRWGGLTVFVRSVDELGQPTTPYVAAWAVQDPASGPGGAPLATAEGLRVGDPVERVATLYPGVVSGEDEHEPGVVWWNAQTPDGQGYAFLAQDGAVFRLSSGAVCGE
jgi:hypothetical protein